MAEELDNAFDDNLSGRQVVTGFDSRLTSTVSAVSDCAGSGSTRSRPRKGREMSSGGTLPPRPGRTASESDIMDNRILYSAETDDTSFWSLALSADYGLFEDQGWSPLQRRAASTTQNSTWDSAGNAAPVTGPASNVRARTLPGGRARAIRCCTEARSTDESEQSDHDHALSRPVGQLTGPQPSA